MARVPLIDPDRHPELAEFTTRVRNRRRGRVINVYRMLLHSPPLAESWFEHVNRVRWDTTIDGKLREIVIVRLAHLAKSAYVLGQHVPELAGAEGVPSEACAALQDWRNSDLFDARERAALAYADSMARGIVVPDEVFEPLRTCFDDRQIVELTVMIGAYIAHTRVLQALEVDPETAR